MTGVGGGAPQVAAVVAVVMGLGCAGVETCGDVVTAPTPATQTTAGPTVVLEGEGGPVSVLVEIAETEAERARGLMFREQLADGRGMLFLFPQSRDLTFWMKDTLISLDMVFIDQARRIVGIVADAEPRSLELRSVGAVSRYVLEVPGGWCARAGVRPGSSVRFEGVE